MAIRLFIEPINLATRTVRGIDFETSYSLQLDEVFDGWSDRLALAGIGELGRSYRALPHRCSRAWCLPADIHR